MLTRVQTRLQSHSEVDKDPSVTWPIDTYLVGVSNYNVLNLCDVRLLSHQEATVAIVVHMYMMTDSIVDRG